MTTLPPTRQFEVNQEVVRLSKRAFDVTATITCKLSLPHLPTQPRLSEGNAYIALTKKEKNEKSQFV